MIYLFDKDEKLFKIVNKPAIKTALQKYALTTERYVSDRLTVEMKGLDADELEKVEYMAIQTMEDAHAFHYFYVAQKSSENLTMLIGVQSGIEELRKSPVFDKRPQNAFAREVIDDLLAGTNWQARFVGETTPHSTNFYYISTFDALKKVCDVWDLEMQFFVEMNGNKIGARYIDFKRKIGQAVGKRVVYGHNALQILQEVERTNIFTALVGRGKGEETGDGYGRKITFENVVWSRTQGKPVDKPNGQKYLELPLMTQQYGIKNADGTMRPKIGFVDFSEEENPEILIERTYKALIDAARPQLTLKTSSVYLRGVKVGDTIRVVRHDKKLDYETRIFEITFNRLNNQSSDIKLGDRIGESNEEKAQIIADKAIEQFVNNEFSNFVKNLPDYLPSVDGFNNNWYGAEDPTVQYPGKVLINDIWYKPDPEHEGHKIMLRWTGEVWEEILRTYDSEALRDRIAEEIAQVNSSMQAQSEEHDRQVADILSNAQSIETLANQAKTDAANAFARANQVKTEAIADAQAQVATVSQALNTAKTDLQNQVDEADAKAVQAQTDVDALEIRANSIADDLLSAKQELSNSVSQIDAKAQTLTADLTNSKNDILAQATAQTALKNRVTTVEATANGTKETVTQLSKTVNDLSGEVTNATQSIKTVEDSIDGVYTTLSKIQVGGANLLNRTRDLYYNGYKANNTSETYQGFTVASGATTGSGHVDIYNQKTNTVADKADYFLTFYAKGTVSGQTIDCFFYNFTPTARAESSQGTVTSSSDGKITIALTTAWQRYWIKWTQTAGTTAKEVLIGRNYSTNRAYVAMPALFEGNTIRDWAGSLQDSSMEFAEYKQTIDGQLTSLSNSYQTLNGQVSQNTVSIETTANSIHEDLTSLQAYVDDEGIRRTEYLAMSELKTAELIATERTAISANYVAKSTYDENVSGTTLKLNEIKTTADTATQNLATYQDTVDRKLTELTTSTQTLDGKINTASAKVDTVAGQIRTEISEVEGNIPQTVSNRNLATGSSNSWNDFVVTANSGWFKSLANISYGDKTGIYANSKVNLFVYISADDIVLDNSVTPRIILQGPAPKRSDGSNTWGNAYNPFHAAWTTPLKSGNNYHIIKMSKTITADMYANFKGFELQIRIDGASSGKFRWRALMITTGDVFPDYWTKPLDDIMGDVSSIKTTITQTSQGVEQLSTSLETTDGKVSTAETKISQLIGDVSSKVSQTDYNTLTGRVSSAETSISQNATEISKRLTSTQVESAITGKGYQTKGDVDSNITGRGYITSSALQPYALSTTVQNLVQETADSFSRTISETKALIPSGESNLVKFGRPSETSEYVGAEIIRHSFFYNGGVNLYFIKNTSATNEKTASFNRFAVERNTDYTLYFKGFNTSSLVGMDVWFLKRVRGSTAIFDNAQLLVDNRKLSTSKCDEVVVTFNTGNYDEGFIRFDNNKSVVEGISAELYFGDVSVKKGKSNNGWSPSVEELATVTALNAVKTTITQTSQGVEQLSTSLATTDGKVSTAETKISQLIGDVSSKVSQTDYNTLTGRVSSAETSISQNATEISKRLTSTQVESAITGKGYQTKGDVDSNITGRGYITSSALQPYALSTTVQNLVQETADSFSRTISETKALIPSGESNLVKFGRPSETSEYVGAEIIRHSFFYNGGVNLYFIKNTSATNEKTASFNRFAVERNTDYTLYFKGFNTSSLVGMDVWFLKRVRGSTAIFDNAQLLVDNRKLSTSKCDEVVVTFNTGNYDEGFIRFDNNKSVVEGISAELYFGDVSVKKGKSNNGWSPSVEELATVTDLHNVTDTVDSHTRTIGAVGTSGSILDNVSKVTQTANGLVTEVSGANGLKTQVSTLAGSYAIKSLTKAGDVLGQINLNPDGSVRINEGLISVGTKTYIQDGVISSAKIASLDAGKITTGYLASARIATNSITGSHIAFDQAFFNNFMANEAYLKQIFAKNAFITSVQAVAISASNITAGVLKATNGALDINLDNASMVFRQDAKIEFQSENNTLFRTRNGTSAFIHFRDDGYNGVYTAMGVNADNTGTQNDYSSGRFAGVRVIRTNPNSYSGTTIDQVQLIGDEIRIRHGYGYENDYLTIDYDGGGKINLMAWLRQFNTNFMHLVNITGRGDVIKTF
ncbi:phage tail spike protein [Streptococcus parasuis]|uniref:phage tail spike protein n=1 Tax=Streptococcus parasuis TaxID=1501662 RepID=UPI00370D7FC1